MRGLVTTLLLLLLLTASGAYADEVFSCGLSTVEIGFVKRPKARSLEEHVEAILSVSSEGRGTILRYDDGVDFIGAICTVNAKQQPAVVFQAYCGGSGCRDQDN